jgi:hypothetical protein
MEKTGLDDANAVTIGIVVANAKRSLRVNSRSHPELIMQRE